jgi:hypothetical protein
LKPPSASRRRRDGETAPRARAAGALCAALLAVLSLVGATAAAAQEAGERPAADDRWAVTLYGGPFTKQDFLEFFTEPVELDDAGMASLAVSRKLGVLWTHLRWEAEVGISRWFGDQSHWELTGAVVARWITWPWNDHVPTTFAVGNGMSFATERPALELANFGEARRLQNYVMVELTLGLPRLPRWDLVIRIHHRSGVFGLLGGSGSTVPAIGIKYKF